MHLLKLTPLPFYCICDRTLGLIGKYVKKDVLIVPLGNVFQRGEERKALPRVKKKSQERPRTHWTVLKSSDLNAVEYLCKRLKHSLNKLPFKLEFAYKRLDEL